MTRRSTTAERLAELTAAVERLADHVQLLTAAVDELVTEVQWRNNQDSDPRRTSAVHVTSMPKDPLAKDWQLNRLRAEDLPPKTPGEASTERQTLFD